MPKNGLATDLRLSDDVGIHGSDPHRPCASLTSGWSTDVPQDAGRVDYHDMTGTLARYLGRD